MRDCSLNETPCRPSQLFQFGNQLRQQYIHLFPILRNAEKVYSGRHDNERHMPHSRQWGVQSKWDIIWSRTFRQERDWMPNSWRPVQSAIVPCAEKSTWLIFSYWLHKDRCGLIALYGRWCWILNVFAESSVIGTGSRPTRCSVPVIRERRRSLLWLVEGSLNGTLTHLLRLVSRVNLCGTRIIRDLSRNDWPVPGWSFVPGQGWCSGTIRAPQCPACFGPSQLFRNEDLFRKISIIWHETGSSKQFHKSYWGCEFVSSTFVYCEFAFIKTYDNRKQNDDGSSRWLVRA
jgi:hypothetical protein